jgi:hypothetical protein
MVRFHSQGEQHFVEFSYVDDQNKVRRSLAYPLFNKAALEDLKGLTEFAVELNKEKHLMVKVEIGIDVMIVDKNNIDESPFFFNLTQEALSFKLPEITFPDSQTEEPA